MEPIILTSTVILGREMATQTISGTTRNILSGISHILDNSDIEFQKILNNLDINFKLEIINNYIIELNDENNLSETVKKCIDYISDSIKSIDSEIIMIRDLIDKNKDVWFKNWRNSEIHKNVSNMKEHLHILENRFDYLIRINIKL